MRLLIVDDSALMRRMLQDCFANEPGIEVATARDGIDALEKLHAFRPDVITLDINMPKMDGLTCLAHIMEERPCPVVMVSSLSEKGAVATFEALELGAADYVTKPDGTVSLSLDLIFGELRSKVQAAGRSRSRLLRERPVRRRSPPADPEPLPQDAGTASGTVELVLIGSSTGGPRVLEDILRNLPADFPVPILVAQHMPPRFTRIFAERLADACNLKVQELDRAMPLEPGNAYIAPGAKDVEVSHQFRRTIARPVDADPSRTWHPSVSRMVASALDTFAPRQLLGVMLTGMGDDGSVEMARIHWGGGRTIAEAEATAVVWGMPQKLIEQDGASIVLPADRIAGQIRRWAVSSDRKRKTSCR